MTLISSITQLGKISKSNNSLVSKNIISNADQQLSVYGSDLAQWLIDLNIKLNILGILKINIHIKI